MPVTLYQNHRSQFQGGTDLDRVSLDGACVVDTAGYGHADENKTDGSTILGFAAVLLKI